jgi:hypothetical protein
MIVDLGKNTGVSSTLLALRRPQSSVFRMREFDSAPLVSFCITNKNRLSQIRKTLPKNLSDNQIDHDKIEFILVDFGSDEPIEDWLFSEFREELASGYLKYFGCSSLNKWHAPKAKNTTHRLSTGKILVNLDGDNFTGYRGGMFVYSVFMSSPNDTCLWQYSGESEDGSFGRIASSRDAFFSVGGYNQEFLEMGFQDRDLVNRLEMIGVEVKLEPDLRYNGAIENDKYVPQTMDYTMMRRSNRRISHRLVASGKVVANNGVFGLSGIQQLVVDGNSYQMIDVEI